MGKSIRNIIIILVLSIILGGAAYYALDETSELTDNKENDGSEDREDKDESKDKEDKEDNNPIEEDNNDLEFEEKDDDLEFEEDDETNGPRLSIEEGKKLPDFTLTNLNGEEVSLSDYEDKIVFINFWATWCGFCDKEMPDLQKINDENDDLVVLGVNVAEGESIVEDYIEEGGYDFEILFDEEGDLAMDYLAMGLPTTHLVNKGGISRGQISGMLTYEQMNEILEDIRMDN